MAESIRNILDDIRKENIQLPDFQRPYVWDGKKVQDYITALYYKFPTGHFLLWKTTEDDTQKNFLVDGQQRITSLLWSIYGELPKFHRGKEPNYTFYFNPFTQQFKRNRPSGSEEEFWINIVEFFSKNDLRLYQTKLLNMESEDLDTKEAALNLAELDKLLDYKYTIDELPRDISMMKAVEIFNQINSSGTKLNQGDLAYASMSVVWKDFKKEFEIFSKKMSEDGYKFSVYFYMRLLAVLTDKSALLDNSFHSISEKELKQSWKKLKEILPYLLSIYRQYLSIAESKDLVTFSPLYIASVFLSGKPKYRFSNEDEINNWMYWTLLAGIHQRYSGSGGDHKIDIDRKIAQNKSTSNYDPIDGLVHNINEQTGSLEINNFLVRGSKASTSNAIFQTYILMLKNYGATDWVSGVEFFPPKNVVPTLHFHHIFPSAFTSILEEAGQETLYMDNLPNRAVLTSNTNQSYGKTQPSVYLKEVLKNYPNAIKEQMIPSNKKLWDLNSFNDFVAERSELLTTAINNFINSFSRKSEFVDSFDTKDLPEEGQKLEYKATFSYDLDGTGVSEKVLKEEIVKTICAFANSDGGKIVIGVDDNLNVVGLEKDLSKQRAKNKVDGFIRSIVSFVDSNLSRGGLEFKGFDNEVLIQEVQNKNKDKIAVLNINPVREKPEVKYNGKIYVRRGSMDIPLKDDEIVDWIKGRFIN